jgi:hypothetical protein
MFIELPKICSVKSDSTITPGLAWTDLIVKHGVQPRERQLQDVAAEREKPKSRPELVEERLAHGSFFNRVGRHN